MCRTRGEEDEDDDNLDDSERRRSCGDCCRSCLKGCVLNIALLVAMAVGVGVGIGVRTLSPFDKPRLAPREMMYLLLPADLLLRVMSYLMVPLVVTSMISGVGAMRPTLVAKMSALALLYYVVTTVLAVAQGIGFMYAVSPEKHAEKLDPLPQIDERFDHVDTMLDMLRNIFPDNLIKAGFEITKTDVSMESIAVDPNEPNVTVLVENITHQPLDAINMLGMTVMAILFGLSIGRLPPEHGHLLQKVFAAIFEAVMGLLRGIFWLYPLGVFFLALHLTIALEDPTSQLKTTFIFILTVLLGLFAHFALIIPALYLVLARRNPFLLLAHCSRALVTAFTTNNSHMALPITMDCLLQAGVHPTVVRFLCPIGANINRDGSALYEAVATLFLAIRRGVPLTPGRVVGLGFTSVAVSIGFPAGFSGDLLTLSILFSSVGLPVTDILLLASFEWTISRVRILVNVWANCVGTASIGAILAESLKRGNAGKPEDSNDVSTSRDLVHDGAVLTKYTRRGPADWTVRLVNETGDRLMVSKV